VEVWTCFQAAAERSASLVSTTYQLVIISAHVVLADSDL
jgi:hypothetical protein